eukprot:2341618-Rhodomonas_salina.2
MDSGARATLWLGAQAAWRRRSCVLAAVLAGAGGWCWLAHVRCGSCGWYEEEQRLPSRSLTHTPSDLRPSGGGGGSGKGGQAAVGAPARAAEVAGSGPGRLLLIDCWRMKHVRVGRASLTFLHIRPECWTRREPPPRRM